MAQKTGGPASGPGSTTATTPAPAAAAGKPPVATGAPTAAAAQAAPQRATAAQPAPPPAAPAAPTALLATLGLHGLAHLDAPVLAALATQVPMLLIGPHGSAKSALLERLAAALGLEHRHYNASLLSFDDLVGFPVPEGDGLKYLKTPATLWGAQSVFLDEISRCRPEVQNKLFSIVHERRVQGIALQALRYRWAAMNPPADPDSADDTEVYAGSLPLDPALADRFGFVLNLPALEDLPPQARRSVIRSGLDAAGQVSAVPAALDLPALVARSREHGGLCALLHGDWITAYTAALVVPLRQAGLGISGRRAAMLAANIAGVHGARCALGPGDAAAGETPGGNITGTTAGRTVTPTVTPTTPPASTPTTTPATSIANSALIALRHSLPHRAQGRPVEAGVVATIHRKAVDDASQAQADAALARILDEAHPVRRVGLALAALEKRPGLVPRHTMSMLVADALASMEKQPRWILAQELLPRLVALDCVDAPTLELLAEPFTAQVAYEQRPNLTHQLPRSRIAPFNALVATLGALDTGDPAQVALGNLGAALYAHDEGACVPAALKRQQGVLRALLSEAERHAH
jgi:MoxR-like ATPase